MLQRISLLPPASRARSHLALRPGAYAPGFMLSPASPAGPTRVLTLETKLAIWIFSFRSPAFNDSRHLPCFPQLRFELIPYKVCDLCSRDNLFNSAVRISNPKIASVPFIRPDNNRKGHFPTARVRDLLERLTNLWVKKDPQALFAQFVRQLKSRWDRILVPDCYHYISRGSDQFRSKHLAFRHHDNNSFQTERKPARRHILARKHPNQIVVPAAAAQTTRQVLDVDLHNSASVISQAARQRWIQFDVSSNS